jgi:hypothetical protein
MMVAWVVERLGISIVMFTMLWVLGCCWNNLKFNQRLALGDAFENSHRCVYLEFGNSSEKSHLLPSPERSV